ncbi:SURF1 family protein [Novosphingobium sp.]|uniref:SURF1 family protein n=1 Tax=Novosphingobium sp. TaxID=1874826 RepID=UPI002B49DC70|nr:SURF1 family protein [Novosphingobium sp.]HKR91855.1 SURF1 family protein [Novosphingobium sp.]
MTLLLIIALAVFVVLGIWQVRRMYWKHDLIARVNVRVRAVPASLPTDARLVSARPGDLDYLRVKLSGVYVASQSARVRAATDLGTGYWAMTVMRLDDGRTIWVNRGFVPEGVTENQVRTGVPAGAVRVIGLLRSTEPGGSLLQSNRPQDDRWYSRDVAALTRAKQAGRTVPVFVDAQQEEGRSFRGSKPVPGLTVVRFADNHLSYALTWFAMAALSGAAIGLVWRQARPKSS